MPDSPLTQSTNQPSRRSEFFTGARDMIPLIVGSVPFGILFGALSVTAGMSWWAAIGLSTIVFAGSAQFVAVGLVSQGVSVLVIVLTTLVVNLRHALYSASLGPYLKNLSQRWIAPLAFLLTDETYAVVIQRFEKAKDSPNKHWYYLGSGVAMYANWQLCTIIGLVAGYKLRGMSEWGLEFAMVVTFIGIVVPLIRSVPMLVSALVAGVVSLLFHDLPHQAGLVLAALLGIVAGVLASKLTRFQRSSL